MFYLKIVPENLNSWFQIDGIIYEVTVYKY